LDHGNTGTPEISSEILSSPLITQIIHPKPLTGGTPVSLACYHTDRRQVSGFPRPVLFNLFILNILRVNLFDGILYQ
jgi:hypothetical protein